MLDTINDLSAADLANGNPKHNIYDRKYHDNGLIIAILAASPLYSLLEVQSTGKKYI